MRNALLLILLIVATTSKAQSFLQPGFGYNAFRGGSPNALALSDSSTQKKWFLTRYSALSTSFHFFRGGHATVVAAPIGLQLNRRLNDHLYAFGNVMIAPSFTNFTRSLMTTDLSKQTSANNPLNSRSLGMYSSASLGLMYVNTEKTFSISGSISVERSNYPLLPYYYPANGQRATYSNSLNR